MAITASGQVKMSELATEFGITASNLSLTFLSNDGGSGIYAATVINPCSPDQPDKIAPHAMTEWYSYDHNIACSYLISVKAYQSTHDVCRLANERVIYATASLAVGVKLYTNSAATASLDGQGWLWSLGGSINAGTWAKISNTGVIQTYDDCGERVGYMMSDPLSIGRACSLTASTVLKYHGQTDTSTDQNYRFPRYKDVVYNNRPLINTAAFDGNNDWYTLLGKEYQYTTIKIAIQINTGGEVIDYSICGAFTDFDIDLNGVTTQAAACNGIAFANDGEHSGWGTIPAIGDYVYGSAGPLSNNWYLGEVTIASSTTLYTFRIQDHTIHEQVAHCSANFIYGTVSEISTDYNFSYTPCDLIDFETVYSTDHHGGFSVGEMLYKDISGTKYPFRGIHSKWYWQNGGKILTIEDTGLIIESVGC